MTLKFIKNQLSEEGTKSMKKMDMAYNQTLANRIREQLQDLENVDEKEMMGGLVFMVNDKMCVGVWKDDLMCRIDPEKQDEALEKTGCRIMDFTGKPMKGWVLIDDTGIRNMNEMNYWMGLALEFNKYSKASKKRKK
jgi:TfoX/Sxy family transcriptional regulator of competence genes